MPGASDMSDTEIDPYLEIKEERKKTLTDSRNRLASRVKWKTYSLFETIWRTIIENHEEKKRIRALR